MNPLVMCPRCGPSFPDHKCWNVSNPNPFPSKKLLAQITTMIWCKKIPDGYFYCGPDDGGAGQRLTKKFTEQCIAEAKEICRLISEEEKE